MKEDTEININELVDTALSVSESVSTSVSEENLPILSSSSKVENMLEHPNIN